MSPLRGVNHERAFRHLQNWRARKTWHVNVPRKSSVKNVGRRHQRRIFAKVESPGRRPGFQSLSLTNVVLALKEPLNPEGILYPSPGLRRSRYPGNRKRRHRTATRFCTARHTMTMDVRLHDHPAPDMVLSTRHQTPRIVLYGTALRFNIVLSLSQGSGCAATPGWGTKSLWDSSAFSAWGLSVLRADESAAASSTRRSRVR